MFICDFDYIVYFWYVGIDFHENYLGCMNFLFFIVDLVDVDDHWTACRSVAIRVQRSNSVPGLSLGHCPDVPQVFFSPPETSQGNPALTVCRRRNDTA